jgi:hypothetical protein
MRRLTIQRAVRLACGVGLLLPAAVQEKVCAWPVPATPATRPPAAPIAPPAADEQPEPDEKQPLTLAAMLPDAVAPRWPGHTHLTTLRRGRPLPVAAWRDAPGSPDRQEDTEVGVLLTGGWPRHPAGEPLSVGGAVAGGSHRADRHVFQTAILRTGPPRA